MFCFVLFAYLKPNRVAKNVTFAQQKLESVQRRTWSDVSFHFIQSIHFDQHRRPHALTNSIDSHSFIRFVLTFASLSLSFTHLIFMHTLLNVIFRSVCFGSLKFFLANASHFSCCFVLFALCRHANDLNAHCLPFKVVCAYDFCFSVHFRMASTFTFTFSIIIWPLVVIKRLFKITLFHGIVYRGHTFRRCIFISTVASLYSFRNIFDGNFTLYFLGIFMNKPSVIMFYGSKRKKKFRQNQWKRICRQINLMNGKQNSRWSYSIAERHWQQNGRNHIAAWLARLFDASYSVYG